MVTTEGNALGTYSLKSQKECETLCDNTPKCNSFGYEPYSDNGGNPRGCWLSDALIYGHEEQMIWYNIYTVYRTCGKHHQIKSTSHSF